MRPVKHSRFVQAQNRVTDHPRQDRIAQGTGSVARSQYHVLNPRFARAQVQLEIVFELGHFTAGGCLPAHRLALRIQPAQSA